MTTTNQINNNSFSRMTIGLQQLGQTIKIFENKDGSFSILSLIKNALKYVIKGLLMKLDLQIINHREKK
jgi:hypothetical protein